MILTLPHDPTSSVNVSIVIPVIFANQSRPSFGPKGIVMNRIVVLGISLCLPLVVVGCSRPPTPFEEAMEKHQTEKQAREDERAREYPTDPAILALIRQAEPYLEPKNRPWVWSTSREYANDLNRDGFPASAQEILAAFPITMQRCGIRPEADQDFQYYCELYKDRRRSAPEDRSGKPRNHQEAIDRIVEQERFSNSPPE